MHLEGAALICLMASFCSLSVVLLSCMELDAKTKGVIKFPVQEMERKNVKGGNLFQSHFSGRTRLLKILFPQLDYIIYSVVVERSI